MKLKSYLYMDFFKKEKIKTYCIMMSTMIKKKKKRKKEKKGC